jgi:hypothetical protein
MPVLRFRAMLRRASEETGRSRAAILADWGSNFFLPKRMLLDEYFAFHLHNPAGPREGARKDFIGHWLNRQINRDLNAAAGDQRALLGDKRIYCAMLSGFGLQTPRIQACAHHRLRALDSPVLRDPSALAGWLARDADYPLFGKPLRGQASEGTVSINRYDRKTGMLELIEGRNLNADALTQEIFDRYGRSGYMFMDRLVPHPKIRAMSGDTTGSVRLVTLTNGWRARPLYAIWKIPAVDAISDTLWRPGNMISLIDIADGTILRVVEGSGFLKRDHEDHPQTGAKLIGVRLPMWNRVVAAGRAAAEVTPGVRMIGWDIAVTSSGPVILEANRNTNHTMLQSLTGRGFLTPEMREQVAEAAVRRRRRKRRSWLRWLRRDEKMRYLQRAYLQRLREQIFDRELS